MTQCRTQQVVYLEMRGPLDTAWDMPGWDLVRHKQPQIYSVWPIQCWSDFFFFKWRLHIQILFYRVFKNFLICIQYYRVVSFYSYYKILAVLLGLHITSMYFICCFVVVQSLSCVQLFATPWTAACQASLSFTISLSLLKLMPIDSMMPSNHLILCHPPTRQ